MPEIVQDLPTGSLALYCVALTVGATWIGVLVVKPILRLLVGGEANLNETIAIATSTFGLFYGLLVGLLAVAAYQNAERVEQSAFREASSIATLYADMDNYPEPLRSQVKVMLRDYVLYAIHKDWPAMRDGAAMTGGDHRADALRRRIASFEPETPAQTIVHAEVVRVFHAFNVARQERLAGRLTRLPDVLWYAVGAGAAVNILLLVMLKMRPLQHLLLSGLVSGFLGVMLFVIIALDDPLRGATGIEPEAMRELWRRVMAYDEPLA